MLFLFHCVISTVDG